MSSLAALANAKIDVQATAFLERYLFEFQETYEEVLDLAESFKKAAGDAALLPADKFGALVDGEACQAYQRHTRANVRRTDACRGARQDRLGANGTRRVVCRSVPVRLQQDRA